MKSVVENLTHKGLININKFVKEKIMFKQMQIQHQAISEKIKEINNKFQQNNII